MQRYHVTGVCEPDHEIVIQIVYVGDDFDRVLLKDREGDPVEF